MDKEDHHKVSERQVKDQHKINHKHHNNAPAGATTKKGGGGAHNWGTEDDDLAGMADGAMEAEQERMAATDSAQTTTTA